LFSAEAFRNRRTFWKMIAQDTSEKTRRTTRTAWVMILAETIRSRTLVSKVFGNRTDSSGSVARDAVSFGPVRRTRPEDSRLQWRKASVTGRRSNQLNYGPDILIDRMIKGSIGRI